MDKTQNEMDKYTRNAVDSLIQKFYSKGILTRTGESLIASIYALKPDAHKGILSVLSEQIVDLRSEFSSMDIGLLSDNFEYVIKKCYNYSAWEKHDIAPTKELLSLISRIAKIKSHDTILLPQEAFKFALDHSESKYAVCTSLEGVAIIDIVSEACHIDTISDNISISECLENPDFKEGFNHILLFPSIHEMPYDVISNIIDCIENGLTNGGSLSVVLPKNVCSSDKYKRLREHLIDNKHRFQTSIITLPRSCGQHKIMLLVIEKKDGPGKIYIGDFAHKEFRVVDEIGEVSLKLNSIIETIEKGDGRYCKMIDTMDLIDGDKFTPSYYFMERAFADLSIVERSQLVPLKKLISIIPYTFDGADEIPLRITTSSLSENYLDSELDVTNLELDEEKSPITPANGGYCYFAHNKVLVGNFQGQDEDSMIGFDTRLFHFEIKSKTLSMDYLLKELTSAYVLEQARMLSGSVYGALSEGEFLSIQIVVPAFEKQNEILLDDSKKGYADKSEEVQRNFDEFRKNMHMQKHKVGQTISALATWVNYLELARQLGKKEDSDVVIPAYNTTVGDIYSNIQDSLKTLQTEIAALDSSYGLEKDAKTFALADFLDSFCNKSCPGYELIWNSQSHRYQQDLKHIEIDDRDPDNIKATVYEDEYIIRAGDPMDYIHFPEKALETILENIIANAVAHGFTDPQKHYQIKFDIERDGTTVVLFVSNNGLPLHKDMVPAEVFTYGHTSGDEKHSGIGGYQILEYMRAFGGSAEIISTPDEEYSVTYKLTFKDANPSIKFEQIEL